MTLQKEFENPCGGPKSVPSRASDELAALFQVRKKKSCAESKKRSYPPKISWGIQFWGFRSPTTSP